MASTGMEVASNNNQVKGTDNDAKAADSGNKQIDKEVSSNKTTADIHTKDPVNNGITPSTSDQLELKDNEAVLKPTEFLPDTTNKDQNNRQIVQSANKSDTVKQIPNMVEAKAATNFDETDGESSNLTPTIAISNTGRTTQATTSHLTAAGGTNAPAMFPLDTTDCGVAPRVSTGSLQSASHDKRLSTPAPISRKKSFRQSAKKLWSRVRGKKTEEESVHTSPESALTPPTPRQTPKPVRVDRLQDAFIHYNHDNKIPGRPHGRGICVIISLFTGELTGYIQDRKNAFNFFSQLGYEVFCDDKYFTNCTKPQLMSSLKKMQDVIAKKAKEHGRPYYDRFALIVLTHGEKGGLMTCADPHGFLEEHSQVPKNGGYVSQRVLTKVEEICDMFKHDQVPALKDKPKLFLIQACRGSDVLRHAGSSQTPLKELTYDMTNLNIRPEIPIDADQIVYYASTPEHESWVAQTGSWFIEKTLEVFSRHHQDRHVEEMMTVINLVIANERGLTQLPTGAVGEVVQMPCKFSTLRMSFFL